MISWIYCFVSIVYYCNMLIGSSSAIISARADNDKNNDAANTRPNDDHCCLFLILFCCCLIRNFWIYTIIVLIKSGRRSRIISFGFFWTWLFAWLWLAIIWRRFLILWILIWLIVLLILIIAIDESISNVLIRNISRASAKCNHLESLDWG